jgi:CBS domain-containing protein
MPPLTLVRDIMSTAVEVLRLDDTLDVAGRLTQTARLRHLPVVDGDHKLLGLVTHRSLLSAWIGQAHSGHERAPARDVPVQMVMERNVLTVWPAAPAWEAAALLEAHQLGCLPVVHEGAVVGIVTEADFVPFARRYLEREENR